MAPKISTPVPDFDGVVAGVSFHKGVGETDDPTAIAYFTRHGYAVDGEPSPPFPDGEPAEDWKADQLKAYAAAKNIDLGGATKKADMLAAIVAAAQS